jgi:plastocyanin
MLTTIEVSPDSTLLIAGSEQSLTIEARDQFGVKMSEAYSGEWAGKKTYVSSAPEIAGVDGWGLVTAVRPGTARITASLTVAGVTRTASMTTVVELPTATRATLTANRDGSWTPRMVSVRAGATVTWVVPDSIQIGTMWLNVWDENAEKLEFVHGVATHTFPTPGAFDYGTGGGLYWYEQGGVIKVY